MNQRWYDFLYFRLAGVISAAVFLSAQAALAFQLYRISCDVHTVILSCTHSGALFSGASAILSERKCSFSRDAPRGATAIIGFLPTYAQIRFYRAYYFIADSRVACRQLSAAGNTAARRLSPNTFPTSGGFHFFKSPHLTGFVFVIVILVQIR